MWAIAQIHEWLIDFTWISPIIDQHRLLTNVCVPDTQDDFLFHIYEAIAKRRNAGTVIVALLRVGFLRAKNEHGYSRALLQIQVRHASATLINTTVHRWVCYVKMKRAFQPMLALHCIQIWLRNSVKLKSIQNQRLINNVAATKIQGMGKGYLYRRHFLELKSILRIQTWYRYLFAWRKYRVQQKSVVTISKIQRALKARSKYWWVSSPGLKKSRMFENQAAKIGFPQREGTHSNPPLGHHVLGNTHAFVTNNDLYEDSRLKLRMFLPTH